jgi:hypothetical protein
MGIGVIFRFFCGDGMGMDRVIQHSPPSVQRTLRTLP